MNRSLSLALSTTLVFVLAIGAGGQSTNTSPAKSDPIQRLFAAWNSHDAEKVVNAFTEDAVYEDVAAGYVNSGRDAIRKWVSAAFADIENFKIDVVHSTYYKGGGVVEWTWSGTDKGFFKTGKNFSVRGVSVIELRAGKVFRYREYYDFASVMRQLGMLPAEK